jgi:ring-1,2-phenylacetyl-CoA epoxidase subunit PaaA
LRNLARSTMPEERFHADFGVQFCTELCKTPEGKAAVQAAIDEYFPFLPSFFGQAGSANNETYRRLKIKLRKNEEMLEDFLVRARKVTASLGLTLPEPKNAVA